MRAATTTSETIISNQFPISQKVKRPANGNFNIQWFMHGKLMETIKMNKPYALCVWKRNEMQRTGQYLGGKLIIVSIA